MHGGQATRSDARSYSLKIFSISSGEAPSVIHTISVLPSVHKFIILDILVYEAHGFIKISRGIAPDLVRQDHINLK